MLILGSREGKEGLLPSEIVKTPILIFILGLSWLHFTLKFVTHLLAGRDEGLVVILTTGFPVVPTDVFD